MTSATRKAPVHSYSKSTCEVTREINVADIKTILDISVLVIQLLLLLDEASETVHG